MLRLFVLRLGETYLRHRFLWLLPIAGMVAFAGLHVVTTKPTYVSLAAVYINKETLLADIASLNQGGLAWVTPAQAAVDQIRELFQTDAFIRSVIQHTDLEKDLAADPTKTEDLITNTRSTIWVNTLGNNTIVLGASSPKALLSQQIATGLIEVFLQWKINTGHQATTAALSFYKDLVTTYYDQVQTAENDLKTYLDAHPVPVAGDRPPSETVEIDRLQRDLSSATTHYQKAQDNLENSQLVEKVNESEVRQMYLIVDTPNYPPRASQSTKTVLINSLIYVIVGVVLSIGGVVLGTLLDQAVRFPDDVILGLELPIFAILPDWGQAKSKPSSKKAGRSSLGKGGGPPAEKKPKSPKGKGAGQGGSDTPPSDSDQPSSDSGPQTADSGKRSSP